jgi:hypothetical protein
MVIFVPTIFEFIWPDRGQVSSTYSKADSDIFEDKRGVIRRRYDRMIARPTRHSKYDRSNIGEVFDRLL